MSGIVVDTSVFMASMLREEDDWQKANETIESSLELGLVVPAIWRYEIRNALIKVMRRGKISGSDLEQALRLLEFLPLTSDSPPDLQSIVDLARRHMLTFYDAMFVELAIRLDAQLATLDHAMARAADAEGITLR